MNHPVAPPDRPLEAVARELAEANARLKQANVGIEDRFAFIAVWLSRSSAKADKELFARLNGVRNDLYHRGVLPEHFSSRNTINLFRKYLALELARQP